MSEGGRARGGRGGVEGASCLSGFLLFLLVVDGERGREQAWGLGERVENGRAR